MQFTKIEDHEAELKDRLLAQFQKDENFNFLFETFAKYAQQIENTLYEIWGFSLDNAIKKRLELEGENVGIKRPLTGAAATDDNIYRALIKATIIISVSNGTKQDVYNLLRQLGATLIRASNIPESGNLKLYVKGNFIIELNEVFEKLNQATAPICIQLIKINNNTPFGFLGNPEASGLNTGKLGQTAI